MGGFGALIWREYLEHKRAYVLFPAILVALVAAAALYTFFSSPPEFSGTLPIPSSIKVYDLAYGLAIQGWWYYTLASLFFYYADTFHGDTRNNAMLFWKSMPQSDLKITASKLVAGLTVFPAAIYIAALVTGLLLILPASAVSSSLPSIASLEIGDALGSYLNLSAIALVYFVFGLLWFAPFFAWIGILSTIFGRWSIPLAFLVPAVLIVFEFVVLRLPDAPSGSYVLSFLLYRTEYAFGDFNHELTLLMADPIDAGGFIANMAANSDWTSVIGGLLVAIALSYLAGQYRRRVLIG